jgi:Xaa-Pro aminopeptidase
LLTTGIDLLLATPSADLVYLIGYGGHASERPTLLAVPARGDAIVIVPRLEAPRLEYLSTMSVHSYEETDDPYALLLHTLPTETARIALSDQAWATVLLGLQRVYPGARFEAAGTLLRSLRMVKGADELDLLRRAAAAVDRAFDRIVSRRFSGLAERRLADELTAVVAGEGVDTSDWGPIVASGPNSASAHHLTGDRLIQQGDSVILDYGGVLDGYQADTTRTVHVGDPPDDFVHAYEVVRVAQQAAVQAVRPGVPAASVDAAARDVIAHAGYGDYFVHRTGHGIGLDTHEEPYIIEGNELVLEPGMTFSVEPGIYLPGRFGIRIEDIVAVTDGGCERLNTAPRELKSVR